METDIFYAISTLILVLWLHRLYLQYKKNNKSYSDYYSDVLKKDEYQVKGKFES